MNDATSTQAQTGTTPALLAVIARRMGSAKQAADAAWAGWKTDRENMEVLHAYNRQLRRLWVLREAGAALMLHLPLAAVGFTLANTRAIELGGGR